MSKYQNLSLFRVPEGFRGRGKLTIQLWWCCQATLFSWSPQIAYGFRRFLLRLFGARIGTGVLIRPSATVTYPWFLDVGDHAWIGDQTVIYNLAQVTIGANVALAHGVYLCTGSHDISSVAFDIISSPIVLEDEVWLANDVFVSPGVTIGEGTVVGARSTVLHDLPSGVVCVGYPCKVIRSRLPGDTTVGAGRNI